jgi:hypothetical protein
MNGSSHFGSGQVCWKYADQQLSRVLIVTVVEDVGAANDQKGACAVSH